MKGRLFIATMLTLIGAELTFAGSLSNGKWNPGGCGAKPDMPIIDGSSLETYNQSVAMFNAWQQQSRTYFECLVNEANADNKLIVETANKEQEKYRETQGKLTGELQALGDALQQQNQP